MSKRNDLIRYYGEERTDLPADYRQRIVEKIEAASDDSIATAQSCVGKHWFIMDFDSRDECPYCGWKLTRA